MRISGYNQKFRQEMLKGSVERWEKVEVEGGPVPHGSRRVE